MIPSALMAIDTIPLTINGKIDYESLPIHDWHWKNKDYVSPRNEREATICSLMASLLKLEQVGAQDDFFEIGGDSLLVTQLAIRLRQTYNIEFPLPQLFTHRTPEAIALLLPEVSQSSVETQIPKLRRMSRSVTLSDDGVLSKN